MDVMYVAGAWSAGATIYMDVMSGICSRQFLSTCIHAGNVVGAWSAGATIYMDVMSGSKKCSCTFDISAFLGGHFVPGTNSRRFRRILSTSALASCVALPRSPFLTRLYRLHPCNRPASLQSYIHAGNVAGAWSAGATIYMGVMRPGATMKIAK